MWRWRLILYRGKVGTTPDEAHEIMRGVPEDRAKRDLEAAFQFLAVAAEREERPHRRDRLVHGRRLFASMLALEEPKLAADVINYGAPGYRCGALTAKSMHRYWDFSARWTAASLPMT